MEPDTAMGSYSIKDLERLSRVKAHTIRVWEKRYGLLRPERSATNIRAYSDDDLRRLLNISLLNERGVKISRIARLSEAEMKARILEMESLGGAPADLVESLIIATMELDEVRFDKVVAGCVLRLGFEQCMFQVLVPFMRRVGMLWQVGALKPGQEHFISNLIRQKVIVAIDGLSAPRSSEARTVVLFLPEGELHELGLLFASYLVRRRGHRTIYLGQSVPMDDLVAVVERSHPDALIGSMHTPAGPQRTEAYLRSLEKRFPRVRILMHAEHKRAGGRRAGDLHLVPELPDLIDLIP